MDRSAGQEPQQMDDRDDHSNCIVWCSTADSNRHRTDSKSVASTSWASGAKWCHRRGLNARPRPYQERALPTERGDGAREGGRLPDLRVTRAALYAELRGHDWWRRRGSNFRSWLYKNPALPLGYAGKKIHKRPGPTRPKHSLPETTVCRPTEGDQYRISGPSYVLAGTAILNSKNASRHHATSQRPRSSAG